MHHSVSMQVCSPPSLLVDCRAMPEPLRICHLASEFTPLAKTGGLADVVGALCRYLQPRGHEVRAFLPFYSAIDTRGLDIAPLPGLQDIPLSLGERQLRFSVF